MNKNRIIEDYLQGKHPIEQNSWELPSAQELERDEALFDSLMAQKKAPKRIRLWPLAVAACVAGFVAIFLVPSRETNVEPEIQPVVAEVVEQPAPEAPKDSEYSEVSENSEKSEPSEPVKPKRTHKVRKVQEEPQLEEAEPRVEENEVEAGDGNHTVERTDPMLLAAAFEQDIRSRGDRLRHEIIQTIINP